MHDFLWYLLCIIAILNWWLYITRILPKLREYRAIYLRDWGFSLFQPLKNLKEYRSICSKEDIPLTWFNTQVFLLAVFIVIAVISAFIAF